MATDRIPLAVAAALLLGGAALHGYEHFLLGERSNAALYVWSLLPYALCLTILVFSTNAIPAIAGLSVALVVDGIAHYKVFVNPKDSTADLLLMYMPLWSTIVFVPVTVLITRALRRPETISRRLMRGAKWTFAILSIFVLAFAAYFAYWTYQYRRADSAANDFCASATIGSDISTAIAQAEAAGIRHGFRSNDDPAHLFMFQGPIFNAFTCELSVSAGKVTAKRIVQPSD